MAIPESSAGLKLTFSSEGAEDLVEIANDGDQALRLALKMLLGLDTLRVNDVLRVEKYHVTLTERGLA